MSTRIEDIREYIKMAETLEKQKFDKHHDYNEWATNIFNDLQSIREKNEDLLYQPERADAFIIAFENAKMSFIDAMVQEWNKDNPDKAISFTGDKYTQFQKDMEMGIRMELRQGVNIEGLFNTLYNSYTIGVNLNNAEVAKDSLVNDITMQLVKAKALSEYNLGKDSALEEAERQAKVNAWIKEADKIKENAIETMANIDLLIENEKDSNTKQHLENIIDAIENTIVKLYGEGHNMLYKSHIEYGMKDSFTQRDAINLKDKVDIDVRDKADEISQDL